MKPLLLNKIMAGACLFIAISGYSQDNEVRFGNDRSNNNTTYAVTDSMRFGVKWNFLRSLDLRTGSYSGVITRLLSYVEQQVPTGSPNNISFNTVAAIAHDKDNKRLYFTPMLTDKLYYIDLKTMRRYMVSNHFTGLLPKAADQSNIITGMVIGDDEKGYALTNDGRHLIRFRTNQNNPSITDLGTLVDAPGNNEMSVHNLCASFGGDLIADDDDHLFLFTSRNHVFKIDTRSRIARYIGTISNLPAGFTTSGAVVDREGEKIIVTSAADSSDVYSVNPGTLAARKLNANRPWYPSDLANGLILKTRRHHGHHDDRIFVSNNSEENTGDITGHTIRIYPNPVIEKEFKIDFANATAGSYTVSVVDMEGKQLLSKTVTMGVKQNTLSVHLPESVSSGIYLVRVTDNAANKAWYSGKIFVQ